MIFLDLEILAQGQGQLITNNLSWGTQKFILEGV